MNHTSRVPDSLFDFNKTNQMDRSGTYQDINDNAIKGSNKNIKNMNVYKRVLPQGRCMQKEKCIYLARKNILPACLKHGPGKSTARAKQFIQ